MFPFMPNGIYPSRGFDFALLATGAATGGVTVTPSSIDSRRTILVVQVRNSGGTGLLPGDAAIVAGSPGTVVSALKSTAFDDGHAITVTAARVTSGNTVAISFPNADGEYYIYEVYGITDFGAAVSAIASVRNTDGGNSPLPTNVVSVAASSENSVVMFMGMRNGNAAVPNDVTGKLNSYSVARGALVGFDTNPSSGTTSYTFATGSPALIIAIAINKDAG